MRTRRVRVSAAARSRRLKACLTIVTPSWCLGLVILGLGLARAAEPAVNPPAEREAEHPGGAFHFKPEEQRSDGAVVIGGHRIDYQAVAGTLVVHPRGWDDSGAPSVEEKGPGGPATSAMPEAAISYVAYFRQGGAGGNRPLTFFYNGGPGSSTVWLHMGAFGPKRVVTPGDQHLPAAPYQIVANGSSLLDVSDLVFVDAPGTGFGRLVGHDKEKTFWGVDGDADAFAGFIVQFLGKFGRWNSAKFLFGESYGTLRSAVLADRLGNDEAIDVNGVILLSPVLNYDLQADDPALNPGVDLPYILALPSYAATAWYHHRLGPDLPATVEALTAEVEDFAHGPYTAALLAGASLSAEERSRVIARLHRYTGLPEAYIDRADLRISVGEFNQMLQADAQLTTGRLDGRFSGPTIDPLSKEADYDPQSSAISAAYVAAFNDYVRRDLKYDPGRRFLGFIDLEHSWNFTHSPPGGGPAPTRAPNVMPDLAHAITTNPTLKLMVNCGYFDLATPYHTAVYEIRHLPMPAALQANITLAFYPSGHMVYVTEAILSQLHDNVARFIRAAANGPVD